MKKKYISPSIYIRERVLLPSLLQSSVHEIETLPNSGNGGDKNPQIGVDKDKEEGTGEDVGAKFFYYGFD